MGQCVARASVWSKAFSLNDPKIPIISTVMSFHEHASGKCTYTQFFYWQSISFDTKKLLN